MRWIALHYIGQEYPYDAQTHEALGYSWQATRDQTMYYDSSKTFPDDLKKVAAQYGLSVNKGSLKTGLPISGRLVARAVNEFRGCCMVFLRAETDGAFTGGHFVGLGRGPEYQSGFYFFDPNYGSFKLAGLNEAIVFLEWFFAKSNYRKTYSNIKVVGVNAPPYVLGDLKQMAKSGWEFA
jgi:hypothetical protein